MKVLIGIIAAIVIVGGAFLWWRHSGSAIGLSDDGTSLAADAIDDAGGMTGSASSTPVSNATSSAPMSATVTYNGTSFSPSTVTIKQGGTVKWVDTNGTMWVASNPHPIHNGYDGTTRQEHCAAGYTGPTPFDQCGTASAYSFTFGKVGSWGYHDHVNHSAMGTVVVVK